MGPCPTDSEGQVSAAFPYRHFLVRGLEKTRRSGSRSCVVPEALGDVGAVANERSSKVCSSMQAGNRVI